MKNVLVVDDLESNYDFIELYAEKKYDLTWAPNGVCALELVRRRDFSAILMDIVMPEMDGYQTLAAVRRLEQESGRPPVPIIAVTAHSRACNPEAGLQAGFDAFLCKPITGEQILRVLDEIAESK